MITILDKSLASETLTRLIQIRIGIKNNDCIYVTYLSFIQMKKIIFVLLLCISFSCTKEEHFLKDKNYRNEIILKFESRNHIFQNRKSDLLNIFNLPISLKEKEALLFLYAYMPLNDLADYTGKYFLQQVKYAFKAQNEFPWGKTISENNFRHFVLPYRVNNENLDSARVVFFKELKSEVERPFNERSGTGNQSLVS